MTHTPTPSLPYIGWKEWCALPDLGLPAIRAKIDTGARTSTLHASEIEPYHRHGQAYLRFQVHPLPHATVAIDCHAPILDERWITSSSGHKERRYVIETTCLLGPQHFSMEITLTNRASLIFRMLLGRNAIQHRYLIDPAKAYHWHRWSRRKALKLYR